MRPFVTFLCLVLCVATMLAPFERAHAHLGHDADTAEIHDGHQHDFDHDGMAHEEDVDAHVVDLSEAAQHGSNLTSVPWLPLFYVVVVLLLIEPLLRRIYTPARREVRLPSQHPPWPPPLRGPPTSI
jgi:hypothetical protein